MKKKWRRCNDGSFELSDGTGNGYCAVISKIKSGFECVYFLGIDIQETELSDSLKEAKIKAEHWIKKKTEK